MGSCRYCHHELHAGEGARATPFCARCGARVAGDPFDTLSACLVPEAFTRELRHLLNVLPDDDARLAEMDDALAACEDLNREILHCAERLQRNDERDWIGLLSRARAHELLERLPLKETWISDLRVAVWTLVSDLERKEHDAVYRRLEEKAARASFVAVDARSRARAEKAWRECLFWLSRNAHPERDELIRQAEAALAAVGSRQSPVGS